MIMASGEAKLFVASNLILPAGMMSALQRNPMALPPLPPGSEVQGLGKAFPMGIQRRLRHPASAQKQLLTAELAENHGECDCGRELRTLWPERLGS